ncbi:MAG: S-layer domain protein, partial [Thermoleophilia bacterium]|nr:S-layer domain protein [Thermoleophilia bacterium]
AGSLVTIAAEGTTVVQFRAIDSLGNASAYTPAVNSAEATVRIDRTSPSNPTVTGGSSAWTHIQPVVITGAGSVDALSAVTYESQVAVSPNSATPTTFAPAVPGATTTISADGTAIVQVRAIDAAGNASDWAPSTPSAGSTAKIDVTNPVMPTTFVGGSTTWFSVSTRSVTATGYSDAVSTPTAEFRTSTTGAGGFPISGTPGNVANITAEGETLVQFRTRDSADNVSAWSASQIVRIDRSNPTEPNVAGGSNNWTNIAPVVITGSGATDAVSTVRYETRTRYSSDQGTTFSGASAAAAGASASITANGITVVQVRALDSADNASAWMPSIADANSTAKVDTTTPTAPTTVVGSSPSWISAASATVTASGGGDDISPSTTEYRTAFDGAAFGTAGTTGSTLSVTAEGETLVDFRTRDAANNVSPWTTTAIVRLDRTNPTDPTVAGGSDAFQNVTDVTVAASLSTDAHGPLSYRYRTSTTGTFSGVGTIGSSVTIADEGTTYVQFSVTDAAGNTTGWLPTTPTAASTIKIDRTAPTEPTVIGGSLSWGNAASVAVAASASSDALSTPTYEYRTSLNSAAYPLTGTAGDNVAVTAQGTTQVQFRAVDGAGNTSAWSPTSDDAGNTVKLDRVLPDAPTVSGGSATFQNVADVTITAASGADALSGLARYEYQTSNDGTTFAGTTTGSSAVIADEGTTYVRFRTVDVAGNLSAWIPAANSAANTVKIDRANPTVPTVTGGSAAYTTDAVTITASGSTDAGSGFDHYESETRTNGVGVWVANSNGPTVVLSLEGTYEVRFRAVDKVGRVSADSTVSAASSASIDTTAPSAPTVASTGDGSVWSTAPSVIVSGSGGTTDTGGSGFRTLQYRETVDGGTPSVAFDGTTDSVFRDGITVVQFRSIDNAGNFSAWAPASGLAGTVKLDRGVPTDPVVIGGSNNYQGTASVTISANNSSTDLYNGPVSYEYRTSFNGAAFTAAQPGHSVAITAEGVTVVQFHATDSVGNTTAWFPTTPGAGNTVKLDHTAPNTPTVTGGSNSWINAQNLVFSASGSTDDHGTVSYMVQRSTNGGSSWSTPVAASAGGTATVTAEGETLLQFAAIDGLGNTSTYVPGANTAAATARLDRSNPTAPTVAGGDTAWHSSASLPVTVTGGSDFVSSVVSYEYRTTFNGGTPSNPVSGSTVSPTAEGTTIVEYRSIDAAGNASAWTTTGDAGTVKLDRTLPSTPVVTGLGATWHATKPKTVSATAIDSISSIAGYQWSYDGTTWVATVSGSDTFALEGSNSIRFRALDQAGNVSAASTPDTLNIDTVVPTAPTAIDGSTTWQKASKTLTVSGGDGTGSTLTYEHETSTDNATWVGLTAGSTVAFSTDGRHYARFRSVDAAGNVSAWYAGAAGSNAAFIDNAAPTGLVVTGGSATYFNTDQTASAGSAVDALEGTENYYYAVDSGSGYAADVAGNSFTATTDGDYLVKFRVDDALGNTTLFSTPVALHIDKTLPSVPNSLAGGNTTWDFGRTTAAFVGTGSTDLGGGAVTYEYELVTNGGAPVTTTTPVVTAQGETLGRVRAKDRAGNYSAYFAGTAPGNTIRIDTVAPTMPTVTGGSLTFQQAARILTGSGSTDVNGTAVVSGGVVYTSEIKLNGGAFGTPINGATRSISGEGTTIVHFKATDAAGNSSAFTSDVSSAENTVNIDTTAPTAPTVTGGSAAWVAGPTQTITASTLGTDVAPGSGVARTEYQVSTDNGST